MKQYCNKSILKFNYVYFKVSIYVSKEKNVINPLVTGKVSQIVAKKVGDKIANFTMIYFKLFRSRNFKNV